jgi:hypothetical protein
MARPQDADGGTDSSMEGGCDVVNKQLRTDDKEWSTSLVVGRGANNSSP